MGCSLSNNDSDWAQLQVCLSFEIMRKNNTKKRIEHFNLLNESWIKLLIDVECINYSSAFFFLEEQFGLMTLLFRALQQYASLFNRQQQTESASSGFTPAENKTKTEQRDCEKQTITHQHLSWENLR